MTISRQTPIEASSVMITDIVDLPTSLFAGPERANAAQAACEGESANLASVHSQAEQDFTETIINT